MAIKTAISGEVLEHIGRLVAEGWTVTDACRVTRKQLGLDIGDRHLWNTYYQLRAAGALPEIPDIKPEIPPETVIPYTDCYILADLHAPYFHTMALTHALIDAQASGIKTCVLLGDAIDNDAWSFYLSNSAPGNQGQVDAHIEACYKMFYAICGVFDKVYWVMGNHELRPLKLLSKRLGFDHWSRIFLTHSRLPSLTAKVDTVPRYYMVLDGHHGGKWELHHQRNYSTLPGRVAQRLGAKQECNVITAHEHRAAVSFSGTVSRNWSVACPAMLDPRKIEYTQIRATLHPAENVGWVVLRDGQPQLVEFTKRNGGL